MIPLKPHPQLPIIVPTVSSAVLPARRLDADQVRAYGLAQTLQDEADGAPDRKGSTAKLPSAASTQVPLQSLIEQALNENKQRDNGESRLPVATSTNKYIVGSNVLRLQYGLYINAAGTGVGKTVSSVALWDALRRGGADAVYYSLFEPDSPQYSTITEAGIMFSEPSRLLDFPATLDKNNNVMMTGHLYFLPVRPKMVLILDSITDAITFYNVSGRVGMSTFAGGEQPMDTLFLKRLDAWARSVGIVLICTVNSDMIPVSARFEAVCKGVLKNVNLGVFQARLRSMGGRAAFNLTLDQVSVLSAIEMVYPNNSEEDVKQNTTWIE